jgi:hypothetical protein
MTEKRAKELSLEVWRYLAEHPEITHKADLPEYLMKKLYWLKSHCPLCELFMVPKCRLCPLNLAGESCLDQKSLYGKWFNANTNTETRREAAMGIVKIIEEWNV